MYKIKYIRSGARDPETIKNMLNYSGIKCSYDSNKDELIFHDFNYDDFKSKSPRDFRFPCLETSTPNYDFDFMEFMNEVCAMSLDHREVKSELEPLLQEINMLLNSVNLKLVEINTYSDFMSAFITHKSAKSSKDIVNKALELSNCKNKVYKDFIEEDIKPDKENNEFTVKSAIGFVNSRNRTDDSQVNFELLQEFLEDYAPNYKYGVVERGGKRFLKIDEFED